MGAVTLLEELLDDTVTLIHHTKKIPAIKYLISAHDILEVTLHIERVQAEMHVPPWSKATSKELDSIRCALLVKHGTEFDPVVLLSRYYRRMGYLLEKMALRLM